MILMIHDDGFWRLVSCRETNEALIVHIFQSLSIFSSAVSTFEHGWPGSGIPQTERFAEKLIKTFLSYFCAKLLSVWFWHPAGELPGKFITAGLRLAKYLRSMFSIWRVGDVDNTRGNPTPMKWPGSGISTERERPLRFNRAYISHTGLRELIAWD